MPQYNFTSFHYAFKFGKLSDVELKITNTSNKTVYFWSMSCSWEDFLLISNSYVDCARWGCDKNVEHLSSLKSGESKVFTTTILINPNLNYTYLRVVEGRKIAETKLGFIIIADVFNDDYSLLWKLWRENLTLSEYAIKKKNQMAIVWSNPLNFL